jgi:dienelactone hydrolase
MKHVVFLGLVVLMPFLVRAEIVEKSIEYASDGTTCEGWHAYDDSTDAKRPGVVIVHQWTGLTDYEKMRARMLVKLGCNVLAADIYGKGVRPDGMPECAVQSGKYKKDRSLYRTRLKDAVAVLKGDSRTDPKRVAAIGYCFGGTGVIELARTGADVVGVVSFHGGLDSPNPEDGKKIRCEVLALHGADDPFVPQEDIAAFEAEMKGADVKYELIQYPGAVHSFTQKMAGDDNSKGAAYNKEADEKSWAAMKAFLARLFSKE